MIGAYKVRACPDCMGSGKNLSTSSALYCYLCDGYGSVLITGNSKGQGGLRGAHEKDFSSAIKDQP